VTEQERQDGGRQPSGQSPWQAPPARSPAPDPSYATPPTPDSEATVRITPPSTPALTTAPTSAPPATPPAQAPIPPWLSIEAAQPVAEPVPAPPPAPHTWDTSWSSGETTQAYPGPDQPRIAWSAPEPRRPRFLTGLAVGLVVALLAAAGAYFAGAATGGGAGPAPVASSAPSTSLHPFEANQKTLNEAKFHGDLTPLGQPWLPYLGGCVADTDTGGPKLQPDESAHVLCRYGGVFVHFAQYKSANALSLERTYRQQLNLTTDSLAPGQQASSRKSGGVSHVQGNYVEYALKGDDGRPLCGIWWNRDGSSGAMFMEALCQEVLGGSWAPLRDLWQRYS
jgi:hypothetical protein